MNECEGPLSVGGERGYLAKRAPNEVNHMSKARGEGCGGRHLTMMGIDSLGNHVIDCIGPRDGANQWEGGGQ